jgi:hypothetical protein
VADGKTEWRIVDLRAEKRKQQAQKKAKLLCKRVAAYYPPAADWLNCMFVVAWRCMRNLQLRLKGKSTAGIQGEAYTASSTHRPGSDSYLALVVITNPGTFMAREYRDE